MNNRFCALGGVLRSPGASGPPAHTRGTHESASSPGSLVSVRLRTRIAHFSRTRPHALPSHPSEARVGLGARPTLEARCRLDMRGQKGRRRAACDDYSQACTVGWEGPSLCSTLDLELTGRSARMDAEGWKRCWKSRGRHRIEGTHSRVACLEHCTSKSVES